MILSKKLSEAFNAQVNAEMWSSNLYLSMSVHFQKLGLNGFAHWMKKQAEEEMEHAYTMASYLIKRQGTPEVRQIDAVPTSWESPLAIFEHVYKHECAVSKMIDGLMDIAQEEKDRPSQDFIWTFIREQVEEEATASDILDRIRKMGETGIFGLDQQYGSRK